MGLLNLLKRSRASVPVPDVGRASIFFNVDTGLPEFRDSTGFYDLRGPQGIQGVPGTGTSLEEVQDFIGQTLVDSNNIDVTYDDTGNVETFVGRSKYMGTVTGASKTYSITDIGGFYERSNGGVAMTDVLPAMTVLDNGYTVEVHNTDSTATISFTGTPNTTVIGTSATTYVLQPLCRQTFKWTGTKWLFGAGNANLIKAPTAGTASKGSLITFTDPTGRQSVISGRGVAYVSILDFGADRTGQQPITQALNDAIAALGGGGGVVEFPPGTYLENSQPYDVVANNVTLYAPAGPNATVLKTTNTTGDQLRLSGYGCRVMGLNFQGPGVSTTSQKTSGVGLDVRSQEGFVQNCSFAYQYDSLRVGGGLVDVDDVWVRFFNRHGIVVDNNSDHRISRASMVNAGATLPSGAGIYVTQTASLVLDMLNIIASNIALDIAPATGVTIPSVKGTSCFFDTSAVGLNMTSGGAFFRSEFTNCWFSSMSTAGIRLAPAAGGSVDGVTFVNCDIYNNVGGTTTGVDTNALCGKWKMVGCSVAGWTTGINLVAGTNHYPTIIANTVGAVSAFGQNGTGIFVGAGIFKGLLISNNDVNDNGIRIFNNGASGQSYESFEITNNVGHLLKGGLQSATAPIATAGTASTKIFSGGIPAHSVGAGQNFRVRFGGLSSSTGTLICRLHAGPAGTTADTVIWTSTTSAAQVANQHAQGDLFITVRTPGAAGVISAEGFVIAGGVALNTLTGAAITPTVNTTVPWFLTLAITCSVGTFTVTNVVVQAL